MQKDFSEKNSRKGIPLDVWIASDTERCQHGSGLKSPWQTHRTGISQESSAWSTSEHFAEKPRLHSDRRNHRDNGSSRSNSTNSFGMCDFPPLSATEPKAGAAVSRPTNRSEDDRLRGLAIDSGTSLTLPNTLIRDCVKELRRLFPSVDRDILEDVTAGLVACLKTNICLADLLEKAVSQLIDVFADDPGIRCSFPKFTPSQMQCAAESSSAWKDKLGYRADGGLKKKMHSDPSAFFERSSDMEFYRAAINSLTEKRSFDPGSTDHIEETSTSRVLIEEKSGAKLRMLSHQIAGSRAQLFSEAAKAFIAGDSRLAKELSARGHELTLEFHDLSEAAAERIFQTKNSSLDEGVIDLHGLHRDEAYCAVSSFIDRLRLNPPSKSLGAPLVICGKGIHSKGAPVLQATAKEALIAAGCTFHVVPGGSGTLAVTSW
jgi:DNA-nicking Smr family endonuclease